MKKVVIKAVAVVTILSIANNVYAGNKDRTGQAGATEMLIDPWGQSTGVFGMNIASVSGIAAMKNNMAGLADVEKTDIGFSHVIYLTNSQVTINNLGFAQKLGNKAVLGVNLMSMGFGDITITDYNNPEGSGTYRPQFLNIGVGFAKEFSNNVKAGLGATFINEALTSVHASGIAFEGGVQYVTGERDNFHFGITLRNLGTNLRFTGTGFTIPGESPTSNYSISEQTPTDKFSLPTYLGIGGSYDFYLDEQHLKGPDDMPKHKLTAMLSFISNSFNNDYFGGGLEYGYKEMFMVRAGYRYEKGIGGDNSPTMYTGLALGATVQKQIGDKGPVMAVDYSFRPTQKPSNGVHVFSVRFMRK